MQVKVTKRLYSPFEGRKDHFMSGEEGIARLRAGLFAFMMEESPMYKLIEDKFYEHEKCGLINIVYLRFADPFLGESKTSGTRWKMKHIFLFFFSIS